MKKKVILAREKTTTRATLVVEAKERKKLFKYIEYNEANMLLRNMVNVDEILSLPFKHIQVTAICYIYFHLHFMDLY